MLGVVLVGNDPVSLSYIKQKKKFSSQIGMKFELFQFEDTITEDELTQELEKLNRDSKVSGYIVQLPLPSHINSINILSNSFQLKIVDGFHPQNQGKVVVGDNSGFTPCTPAGIMEIFKHYQIGLKGKNICILGRSNIVGKPLTLLCINKGATVISCNSQTSDIQSFTKKADIIICATGQAHILKADMISEKAIIIDVGFSVIDGSIYEMQTIKNIIENGNPITPVPGGVGPMTVAMLMKNTYKAHTHEHIS